MKYQKLLSIATSGLLLGASGVAMAQNVNTCPEGRIIGEIVDEIVIDGQPCLVYETVVSGKVQVTNSPQFEITFSEVGGPMTILGRGATADGSENATVSSTEVLSGNVEVTNFESALVLGNRISNGNLKVNNNLGAVVVRNAVGGVPPENGNIECTGNTELDARGNRATGEVNCAEAAEAQ